MAKVCTEVIVEAEPPEVWAVVTDASRLGEWVTVHGGAVDEPPTELREGDAWVQEVDVPVTSNFEVEWVVEQVDEGREVVWHGSGPGGGEARTRCALEPVDGATRVVYETEYSLPGGALGAVAGRVAQPLGEREASASLERLKHLVEG